jgi:hypothetical protein
MKLLDIKKIDGLRHKKVTFIRVEPVHLHKTLLDIVETLSDVSWISQFDEEYVRESFLARATPTIEDICKKLSQSSTTKISSDAGEYVVSELSRAAINNHMKYNCLPLAELYSKQKSGNPGFDFHLENDCKTLVFGEAKYLEDRNAYGSGLQQIAEFLADKKDLKDLADLGPFFDEAVLQNVLKGQKGFAVGFASKATSSDLLIKNILKNPDYEKLLPYHEIILVAVNI